MANDRKNNQDYAGSVRRITLVMLVSILLLFFAIWRIDNPRIERLRADVIDTIIPHFEWVLRPATWAGRVLENFQSYQALYQQNQELNRELQKMKSWKEAALQLEQENARLLDLNNLRQDPTLTHVSGIVIADSGSPFRQSVLLNVGAQDGIRDGWPAMDGLGLVGRISGVGQETSRVILLTDNASRIPVIIQPSGQRAFVSGDNSNAPLIDFLEDADAVRPGDRISTSGDSGVLPAGLLIGQLALDPNSRLRVRLSADYERLEFLRVLRTSAPPSILGTGDLLVPDAPASTQNVKVLQDG